MNKDGFSRENNALFEVHVQASDVLPTRPQCYTATLPLKCNALFHESIHLVNEHAP